MHITILWFYGFESKEFHIPFAWFQITSEFFRLYSLLQYPRVEILINFIFSGCIQKDSFEKLKNDHLDPEPYVFIHINYI